MSEPQITLDVAVIGPHDMDTLTRPNSDLILSVRSFGLTDPGKVRPNNEVQPLLLSAANITASLA